LPRDTVPTIVAGTIAIITTAILTLVLIAIHGIMMGTVTNLIATIHFTATGTGTTGMCVIITVTKTADFMIGMTGLEGAEKEFHFK
jgi:hypothetical protein